MPLQLQVTQTGLERSIQEGMKKAGRNLKLNLGNTRNIDALSQPLGRLTGKADEFTKSMEAANARVLAFGASVGVIAAVTKGMQELVRTTIEVEKSMANINSILRQTDAQMSSFKDTLFDVARNTEQTFASVADAALELSRQGLKAEEVTNRLNDALILSRLSGMSAADSVAGLTAAINSFSSSGITSAEVLNKISAAAASAAVSDRDLIEGLKRSGAVAVSTGVEFDQLVGIIGALQEKTARGGAVIGNSLKTIFTRIQDVDRLKSIQNLGVEVTDLQGNVLSANKVIENLAPTFAKLDQASKVNLADNLVGKFQIAPFLSLLEQYNEEVVRSNEIAKTSFGATNEAYERNIAQNKTLSAVLNKTVVNLKELGNTLGEIGVTDNLKNVLGFFNSIAESIQGSLDGEGAGGTFAKGLVKGIGAVLSGPGLVLLGAVVTKLAFGFVKFGTESLKTFFGLNQAAKEQANLQGQITSALLNDSSIRQDILHIENKSISVEEKRRQQAEALTTAMNAQLTVMKEMQLISQGITPSVAAGTKAARSKRAAGGFLPIGAESSDIARGVGGAPSSARPVVIPNFAFGGGKRGTMVANSSEYIVPNYANGGDAIFNQNMASSMGLPANAKKVRAANGFIPNFAEGDPINSMGRYVMLHGERGKHEPKKMAYYHPETNKYNVTNKEGALPIRVPVYGLTDSHKGNTVDEYIKKLEDYSYDEALKQASELSGKQMPKPLHKSAIKAEVNAGAVAGFAGSIYELALATLLTDEEFVKYTDQTVTSNFDLNLQGQDNLLKLYNIGTKPLFGEVKGRNNPDNVASSAAKIHRVMGMEGKAKQSAQKGKLIGKRLSVADAKRFGITPSNKRFHTITASDVEKINSQTPEGQRASFSSGKNPMFSGFVKRSASGYIPNFADPLQDAIGREQAAGLPVNQIRINQSGKLRNSQNPMGLAVTNTRDEPTGAVPNFAAPWNKGVKKSDVMGAGFTYDKKGVEDFNKSLKKSTRNINNNVKGQRDLTGIIFGVQAGMTALSAATGDSTSALGRYTSIVSGSMASASSFVFAGQAASQFGENMKASGGKFKGAIGGAIGKIGLYGAAFMAGMEAFKLGENLIAEYTGATKAAKTSVGLMGDAAEKAAGVLGSISGQQKMLAEATTSESFRNFADRLFGFKESTSIKEVFTDSKTGKLKQGSNDLTYQIGVQDGAQEIFKKALEVGIEENVIKRIFAESAYEGGVRSKMEKDELISASGKLAKITESMQSAFNFIDSKLNIAGTGGSDVSSAKALLNMIPSISGQVQEEFSLTADAANKITQRKILQEIEDKSKVVQEAQLKVETVRLDILKSRIADQIKAFSIDQKRFSLTKKQIVEGEILGNLTEERKRQLELQLEVENLNISASEDIAKGLLEQISSLEGINATMLSSLGLEEKISKALRDGNISRKESEDILDQAGLALKKQGFELGDQKEKMSQIISSANNRRDKEVEILRNNKGIEESLLRQKQTIDSIASRSELEGSKKIGQSKLDILDKNILTRGSQEDLRRGSGAMSIQQQRGSAVSSAQLELERVKFEQSELVKQAKLRAGVMSDKAIFELDPIKQEKMMVASAELELVAERNATAAIASATAQLQVAKEAGLFKNALTLAKDAVLNFGPQLEQLKFTEATAATVGERNKAKFTKEAIQGSIAQGGTASEIIRRANEEELRKSIPKRVTEQFGDPLVSSSQLKDDLISSSHQFLMNMDQAFRNAIQGADNLGDALLSVAKQFLGDITGAFSKKFINDSFGSIFGENKNATGGFISGGSGHKDDIPAMLMGGEFVMRKSAVQKYGAGFFNALNNGGVQGYASGGSVRQRRDKEGLFRTPSSSSGYISGVSDLMSFATQSPNRMGGDSFVSGGATAAFLDPESARLSMFGRRNSQQFGKVQDAKKQAFDLAVAEMGQIDQARIAGKESSSQFFKDILSAGISAGLGGLGANMFKGNKFLTAASGFGSNLLGTAITGGGASGFGNFGAGYVSSMQESGSKGLFDFLKSLFSNKQATGGMISSSTGVDTVPTMLSGGEFIMNAAATKRLGAGNLQALNSGSGGGGDNSQLVGKLDELITATESASGGEINITINSEGRENVKTSEGASEDQKKLSERIKTVVKQVITDEKRLGGQLRK